MARKRLPWDKEKRKLILERDGYTCVYCGTKKNLSLDHVMPIKSNGSDRADNVITSCKSCNSKKNGNRLLPNYEEYILKVVNERNKVRGIPQELVITYVPAPKKAREVSGIRWKNRKPFCRRIRRAVSTGEMPLVYAKTVPGRKENMNVVHNCRYHGFDFLSMPTGNGSERYVVINGPVKGSELTSLDEVLYMASLCEKIVVYDRSKRASGKLGLK